MVTACVSSFSQHRYSDFFANEANTTILTSVDNHASAKLENQGQFLNMFKILFTQMSLQITSKTETAQLMNHTVKYENSLQL